MAQFHNKVINYTDLSCKDNGRTGKIINRKMFLNATECAQTDKILETGKDLKFLPTYLWETPMQDVKYAKAVYKIILVGITPCGQKINVIVDGIVPYFEVQVPHEADHEEYKAALLELLNRDEMTRPIKVSETSARNSKGYVEQPFRLIQLHYNKAKDRHTAIKAVMARGYTTLTDDLTCYYRVVCREQHVSFSNWVNLTRFTRVAGDSCSIQLKGDITLRVNINDYKSIPDEELDKLQLKDKSVVCSWDIETWSKAGDVPLPSNPDDCITHISMHFRQVDSDVDLLNVCLCDYPSASNRDYLTVICGNELFMIKAFADMFDCIQPEFIDGFNDSDYDWPWIVNRAKNYKGTLRYLAERFDRVCNPYQPHTDENVFKFNYKKEHVKVEADNYVDGFALMMHGYLPIDVRTIFRRIHPTAEETNLKWFLQAELLPSKEDMPYQRLFRIYREYRELYESDYVDGWDIKPYNTKDLSSVVPWEFKFTEGTPEAILQKYASLKEEFGEVNKYCIKDSALCYELLKRRNVITENRLVADMSYVSVYDSFFRAGGVKVRNLTMSVGIDPIFNIKFSNINTNENPEQGKYPGAYVFPPKKGLNVSKLSIDERIRKAELTRNKGDRAVLQDWLNTPETEKQLFYYIIEKYGAYVANKENIEHIEKEEKCKLPKKFKEFLLEPIGRPITGLDFASLYPSLIRAYNFSPEYYIPINRTNTIKKLEDDEVKLNYVEFPFNGTRRAAHFIHHNNQYEPYMDDPANPGQKIRNPNFRFGLYPYILDKLFNKRAQLKKKLKVLEHIKEEMEAKGEEHIEQNKELYKKTAFEYNYLNSKQAALKVFMNTFYGEAGNKLSPLFVLELAGGITTKGKENLKAAHKYVLKAGCSALYGDTDSIYLSTPEAGFIEHDKAFYTDKISKLEYWTKLVETTFNDIVPINKGVNQMLFERTGGTTFLSMAYEEVLYPVIFTAKKKYFGIPHKKIANFKPQELFIKGLEVKKRGVSEILKKIFNELMWDCVNPENLNDVMELVLDKIDYIYAPNTKWDYDDFIQTAIYRPRKKNVKVITCVNRMLAEHGITVKPNERFSYVTVKKYPFKYDYRGRKVPLSGGDKMELVDIAKERGFEIDLDHYMSGGINGQLGRLLVYHPMFHVDAFDDSPEEAKKADEKIYANACKFVDDYCKKYYAKYNTFGKTHQKLFRTTSKVIGDSIARSDDVLSKLLNANVGGADSDENDNGDFVQWFNDMTRKEAIKECKGYGKEYIKNNLAQYPKAEHKERLERLHKIYYGDKSVSIYNKRENSWKQTMNVLRQRINNNSEKFKLMYTSYHVRIESLMKCVRDAVKFNDDLYKPIVSDEVEAKEFKLEDFNVDASDIVDMLKDPAEKQARELLDNAEMREIATEFKRLYYNMKSAHLTYEQTCSIVEYLKECRDRDNHIVLPPSADVLRNQAQLDAAESARNSTFEF